MRIRTRFVAYLFATLLGSAVGGCMDHNVMTLRPTVYIDDAFRGDEGISVSAGLDTWEENAPGVYFRRVELGHADIISRGNEDNAIFIVRNEGSRDADCPFEGEVGHRGLPPYAVGMASTSSNGSSVICLDASFLNGSQEAHREETGWDGWKTVTAHEIGHALGLHHDTGPLPAVMYTGYGPRQPDTITCEDVRQFTFIWGLQLPSHCLEHPDMAMLDAGLPEGVSAVVDSGPDPHGAQEAPRLAH
jgi:hypothetical protein